MQQFDIDRHLGGVHEVDGPTSSAYASDGEVRDFVGFYRDHYRRAFKLAWLLTNGGPDCDDIVQDAFLRVEGHLAEMTNPPAYLRTTVVNLCRERQRRRSREGARDRLATAGSALASHEPDSNLLDLVGTLPYAQRAVLILRYWSDLPDSEIAQILGVRQGTVRSLVHRANRRLHKELSREH